MCTLKKLVLAGRPGHGIVQFIEPRCVDGTRVGKNLITAFLTRGGPEQHLGSAQSTDNVGKIIVEVKTGNQPCP